MLSAVVKLPHRTWFSNFGSMIQCDRFYDSVIHDSLNHSMIQWITMIHWIIDLRFTVRFTLWFSNYETSWNFEWRSSRLRLGQFRKSNFLTCETNPEHTEPCSLLPYMQVELVRNHKFNRGIRQVNFVSLPILAQQLALSNLVRPFNKALSQSCKTLHQTVLVTNNGSVNMLFFLT